MVSRANPRETIPPDAPPTTYAVDPKAVPGRGARSRPSSRHGFRLWTGVAAPMRRHAGPQSRVRARSTPSQAAAAYAAAACDGTWSGAAVGRPRPAFSDRAATRLRVAARSENLPFYAAAGRRP